jgi:WD40 repeat protein
LFPIEKGGDTPRIGFTRLARISSDGKVVAYTTREGKIMLWSTITKERIAVFDGHNDQISSLQFSRDGKQVASTSHDSTFRIWDCTAKKQVAVIADTGALTFLLSPNKQDAASGDNNGLVRIWDIQTGKERTSFQASTSSVMALAYHPLGHTLMTNGEEKAVRFWRVK